MTRPSLLASSLAVAICVVLLSSSSSAAPSPYSEASSRASNAVQGMRPSSSSSKAAQLMMMGIKDLDPIDACLFYCQICFQKELLLTCANKVCLRDLPKKNPLSPFWKSACPGLDALPFF